MNKSKSFLIAGALCLMTALVWAGSARKTPYGPNQALASADYGGVDVSTLSLSASLTLAFRGAGVFQGVVFTTPTLLNEYVDIFDSSATTAGLSSAIGSYPQSDTILPIMRIYNSTTTASLGQTPFPGQIVPLKYPLRVENGLVYKYQFNTLHLLSVLYTKDPDQ